MAGSGAAYRIQGLTLFLAFGDGKLRSIQFHGQTYAGPAPHGMMDIASPHLSIG